MTFIASVVAKNGVAIIADSLVTATEPVIEVESFFDFLGKKQSETPNEKITVTPEEVLNLAVRRPTYTKDFEEKLFEYDKYTAITTAGGAKINDKKIAQIIEELKTKNRNRVNRSSYSRKNIEAKIKDFCEHLISEVKAHLSTNDAISETSFIFSNFSVSDHKVTIYRVEVLESQKVDLEKVDHEFVTYRIANDIEKVVCDGQNRIAEGILYGKVFIAIGLIDALFEKIKVDLGKKGTEEYLERLRAEMLETQGIRDSFKISKLTGLSLQEAVNLANLLMKVEIDFQKYTEKIPTVGGVIKIAVIDSSGFKYVTGNEIINPNKIHL